MNTANLNPDMLLLIKKQKFLKKVVSLVTIVCISLSFGTLSTGVKFAHAAALTNVSDTLSNPTANASSTHSIVFTVATAMANSGTIVITFTGYANLGGVGSSSVDILVGNSTTTAAQQTIQAAAAASTWGVATSSNVLTLTAPTSGGTVPGAGQVVIVNIGTNAIAQASGTQMLTNPAAGSYVPTITTASDSGSYTLNIIANAIVTITATVAQSLTFAILSSTSTAFSNSIFYGTLSSANVKFASSTNILGDTASTTAHVLTLSTNAPTGYTITMQGDTLRNQNATGTYITPIGGTATGGVVGSSQFGINVTASGGTGAIVDAIYSTTNKYGYNASSTVADTLAFGNVPTTTTTFSIQYMANIPATQAAGAYSTAITYVGTANF